MLIKIKLARALKLNSLGIFFVEKLVLLAEKFSELKNFMGLTPGRYAVQKLSLKNGIIAGFRELKLNFGKKYRTLE